MLVLLNGDSELREQVSMDLVEMNKVGAPDGVEVEATLYRGDLAWNLGNLPKKLKGLFGSQLPSAVAEDWRGRRTYHVRSRQQDSRTLMVGRPEQSKPSDLQALRCQLVKGMKAYPSKHTMVVVGGHSNGHKGLLIDGEGGRAALPQFAQILKEAQQEVGRPIDVLGIEGCASGQVSVGYELRESAGYLVASAGILRNNGWDFQAVLSGMNPQANPEEMATYLASVADEEGSSSLRAVDLSRMESLAGRLADLEASEVDTSGLKEYAPTPGGTRVDLAAVATRLGDARLQEELDAAVLNGSDGLSIYVPAGQVDEEFRATAFAARTGWGQGRTRS